MSGIPANEGKSGPHVVYNLLLYPNSKHEINDFILLC